MYRSSAGSNIFQALHCQSNFAVKALHKGVRKHKFNINLRANAVVKFQSQSTKVKQMGTCPVPTPAAWLVHRASCEKNSRPHGGQAEKRAGGWPHMCYGTPHLGLHQSSTNEQDSHVQLDPKIELWGLKGCMAVMILRCPWITLLSAGPSRGAGWLPGVSINAWTTEEAGGGVDSLNCRSPTRNHI